MDFANLRARTARFATYESPAMPGKRTWRLALAIVPLLAGGCASLAAMRMTPDEVVSTWLGHNVDELQSQWRIIWDSSTDSATGNKTLIAHFGENAHVENTDYVEVRPVGNNQYINEYRTDQRTVAKRNDCVVNFYWNKNTGTIERYSMEGDRCREYVSGYGPAKTR